MAVEPVVEAEEAAEIAPLRSMVARACPATSLLKYSSTRAERLHVASERAAGTLWCARESQVLGGLEVRGREESPGG